MNASNSNTSNLWLLHAGCNKDPLYLRAGAMECNAMQCSANANASEWIRADRMAGWLAHPSLTGANLTNDASASAFVFYYLHPLAKKGSFMSIYKDTSSLGVQHQLI